MKVQAFWHGPWGTMESMCVKSHLRRGNEFHLYAYSPELLGMTRHSPLNFKIHDAREILPEAKMQLFPSTSIFSDFFRYALLAKNGGWYVDMDTICLRPFDDLVGDYIFARDNLSHDDRYVTGFVMKVPQRAPMIMDCYNWINGMAKEERDRLGHMDIGPNLLQSKVPQYGLQSAMAEKNTFDPIPWDRVTWMVDPAKTEELEAACKDSYVVHLRQSIWNGGANHCAGILPDKSLISTDGHYPEDCFWSRLKSRCL